MNSIALFSGQPLPRGGLSNENELKNACPPDFLKSGNPWTSYAGNAAIFGSNKTQWQWKSSDKKLQERQLECFNSVLDGPHHDHLRMSERSAIAGWMLSHMLEAVPST